MVCWTLATRLLWSFHDMIWIAFNTVLFYAAWWPSGMGGGWGLLSVVVFVLGAFYSWFSFLHVYCVVELTECTDFWNNFAPPIQYLLIYFGLTYFTALLCLSLTISWSVRNFNAGCSCRGAKKKTGTDCFAFKFCSWWCNGIYEEWKPEILGCRRHISPGPVLRPHSTPSETCLCIINWFRYAESFFFWSFGYFLCLEVWSTWIPHLTSLLISCSRYIRCASVSDGVTLQEVQEDIPSQCHVPCIPGHGWRLLPRDLA